MQNWKLSRTKKVLEFVGTFAEHCNPASIYVCDDSRADEDYIKAIALKNGEEHPMANSEQTIHWDGYGDQARDKVNTRYMVSPENMKKMKAMNSLPYDEALKEIMGIAKNIMAGKEAYVKFFTEGPAESPLHHSLYTIYRLFLCNPFRIHPLQTRIQAF